MALDACYLTFLTRELQTRAAGARVEKIHQPGHDEVILYLRSPGSRMKLLLSCTPSCARITLTEKEAENPAQPPLFCMVLRKHLTGARLERIFMPQFERAVFLEFTAKNDFFEPVARTLILEILGRSTNIILLDEKGVILEAIRRTDITGGRQVLPGLPYQPIPAQEKKPFIEAGPADLAAITRADLPLWKAILDLYAGISPVVAREMAFRAAGRTDPPANGITPNQRAALETLLEELPAAVKNGACRPTAVKEIASGQWLDFSFLPILQYGAACEAREYPDPVALIEEFFNKSAEETRLRQKTRDVEQLLTRTAARISRTMHVREKELAEGEKAEHYRVCGELLQANLHRAAPGMREITVENYYEDCAPFTIPLRPDKSARENAQLYFKKYRKAKTSARVVAELIERDRADLSYLDSVMMALCEAETAADVDQIREELVRTGFSRARRKNAPRSAGTSQPRRFLSTAGFTILVGRNNLQNDLLTVKLSRKNDIWLHTKGVHSAHVLIVAGGRAVDDRTIVEAAGLCAYFSKAREAPKVEVDYCPVSHVRKPNGARPGMVVYDGYSSVTVPPKLLNGEE